MNAIPRSAEALTRVRKHLLLLASAVLYSALPASAFGLINCVQDVGSPENSGPIVVDFKFQTFLGSFVDLVATEEPFTIDWGDGTTTTNLSSEGVRPGTISPGPPQSEHLMGGSHTYVDALRDISITVQVNGESCTTNSFNVLVALPSSTPPPQPTPASPPLPPSTELTLAAVEYYYALWDAYFVTAAADEIAALDGGAFGGVWKRTGEQFKVYPMTDAKASGATVWRFFSTAYAPLSSHFYTANIDEYHALVNGTVWQLEGPVFGVPLADDNGTCPGSNVPVYRMYNNGMRGAPHHRFTTNLTLLGPMRAAGWIYEGVAFCSPQ